MVLSWYKRSLVVSLLALAVAYPFFFWRFHTGKPVLSRNFAAERNARWEAVPDAELAGDLYREAYERLERLTGSDRGTLDREWPQIFPGDPLWPEAIAYLDRNEPVVEMLWRATSRPFAGFRLSLRPHLQAAPDAGPEIDPALAANPPVLDLVLDSLGPYRSFARLLSVDARATAESGDARRCTEDLTAMLGLARHAEEHETLIADLVSLAILDLAATSLGDIQTHHPDLLRREHLSTLLTAFQKYRGGRIRADLAPEEDFLADVTQRLYTDNGSGGGRMCAAGSRQLDRIAGGDGRLGATGWLLGPINAEFLPSRREFTDKYTAALAKLEKVGSAPLWEWSALPGERLEAEMFGDTVDAHRFRMLQILLPALGKAITAHEFANQHRDAALAMIGCALYRLDHALYPGSISELVPGYLPELPRDRYDGGPLKIAMSDTGMPILYSIGSDRVDDGGVAREADVDGDKAMEWYPPDEARLLPPGDWIVLPSPRPVPYPNE